MKKLSKIFAVVLCLAMVMAMLPMTVSAATETCVEFTVDSLGLTKGFYTADTATVSGVNVEWIQLGNYGNGIQMRDKEGNTSMFWNTSALSGSITKIEFTYNDAKKAYADNEMIVNFGSEAKGDDCAMVLTTIADTKTYTITPTGDYSYFYIEWDTGYSSYWDSIKVYYNGDGSETPDSPVTPDTPDTPDEPETPDVPTAGSIANGEYVIYAPAYNKALSSNYAGTYYNQGVDVTEADGVVIGYGETEIWTVTNNDDGTISISAGGKKLAMGDSFSSMPLGEVNDKWVLEDAGNGLYYVKNVARGCYIEWFASKSNWSGFAYINEGTEGMFALKFYGLNVEEPEVPEDPEDPEEPEVPENPETPETPEDPTQPADPTEPSVAPSEPVSNGTCEEPSKGISPVIWIVIGVAVVAAAVVVVLILKKKN